MAQKASQTASKAAQEILSKKKYVTGGPCLWVSTLLHEKGCLSTNRIWEEFLRDEQTTKDMIPSKSFLKSKILNQMQIQGKIVKDRALDMPEYKRAGWKLEPAKAFKNVHPSFIMTLDPIPQLDRVDVRDYIEKQYELFQEAQENEELNFDSD